MHLCTKHIVVTIHGFPLQTYSFFSGAVGLFNVLLVLLPLLWVVSTGAGGNGHLWTIGPGPGLDHWRARRCVAEVRQTTIWQKTNKIFQDLWDLWEIWTWHYKELVRHLIVVEKCSRAKLRKDFKNKKNCDFASKRAPYCRVISSLFLSLSLSGLLAELWEF